MQNEIKHTWQFNLPPHKVWEYLTVPHLLGQWLMECDFKPTVGHKFRFTCSNTTDCEVLEVKPYTLLVYSWQAPSAKGGKVFTSTVTWTLTPNADGTQLQLVHSGFTLLEDLLGHDQGWIACGNKLAELSTATTTGIAAKSATHTTTADAKSDAAATTTQK